MRNELSGTGRARKNWAWMWGGKELGQGRWDLDSEYKRERDYNYLGKEAENGMRNLSNRDWD